MGDDNTDVVASSNPTPTPRATRSKTSGWKTLESMGTPRAGATGVWANDHQFLVMGGKGVHQEYLSSCEYYDTNSGIWYPFPIDLPLPLYLFGAVVVDNRVFVVGGEDSNAKSLPDLVSLDLSGEDLGTLGDRRWKTLLPMKQARESFACATHSGFIYVFGGWNRGVGQLDSAERYNIKRNEWEDLLPMPGKYSDNSAVVVGEKIYIVGGYNPGDRVYRTSVWVFDISSQQWESSSTNSTNRSIENSSSISTTVVPDMRIPRGRFEAVAVNDRYIVVIGGYNHGQGKSVIEVLDIQRNEWGYAPIPLKKPTFWMAAAFRKKTNEIIVAGGSVSGSFATDAAYSIDFHSGILPTYFQFSEGGQMVEGDTDYGTDSLGLVIMANAMAEYIIRKALKPPFVVGIHGIWGQGKSFFFHLMLKKIIQIQKRRADAILKDTFAGHIYVVKFNAWTFSKGQMMSSLMYQILKELNEQMEFEKGVGNDNLIEGLVSTIEVFQELSTGQREYLKEKDFFKHYEQAKKMGDNPSKQLLAAINANYAEDQKELEEMDNKIKAKEEKIRNDIKAKQEKIRKERETKRKDLLVADIKGILNGLGRRALERVLKEAHEKSREKAQENDDSVAVDASKEAQAKAQENDDGVAVDASKEAQAKAQENDDSAAVENLIKDIEAITGKFWNIFKATDVPPSSYFYFLLILIFAFVIFLVFENKIFSIISGLLSPAIPIIASVKQVKQAIDVIDPLLSRVKDQSADTEDVEEGSPDDKDLKELKELENEKAEIKRRIRGLEGSSLHDAIAAKMDSQEYEKKLGIAHTIEKDLQELSEAMMNNNKKEDLFPRGDPRIILFVDDLDRCEQNEVVEVVEALQLLVKTKLFVAVLAIDPRYVCNSIEKKYTEVLHPHVPPSAMDFLEKIIQLPFRLPVVERDNVDKYVKSQIDVKKPQDGVKKDSTDSVPQDRLSAADSTSAKATDQQEIQGNLEPDVISSVEVQGDEERRDKSGNSEVLPDEPLRNEPAPDTSRYLPTEKEREDESIPNETMLFEEDDVEMIIEVFRLFRLLPRSLKRIINSFKVMQVIWDRDDSGRFKADRELKAAILFVMALSSQESTRIVTYTIFEWMESGMIAYHHVAEDDEEKYNNLAALFRKQLILKDKSFKLASGKKGTLMAHIDTYLSQYKWKTFKEWDDVSSKFLLARTFSFFRRLPDTDTKSLSES